MPSLSRPKISVVILNYNGHEWLSRCFDSLARQTILGEIEIIVTDNGSSDASVQICEDWFKRLGRGQLVQNGKNLWYCEANNNGAAVASGEFLLFLNNDTWLENDCLQKLYDEVIAAHADAGTPLVLDYDDAAFQSCGAIGLDLFGMPAHGKCPARTAEIFTACGCSLLIRTELFRKIGGFPPELLIYADETDLSWRVWIAGGKVVVVPDARLHHRGAAVANPAGGTKHVESRTTDFKRFLANRNGLIFILKNARHVLLLLVIPHLFLLLAEAAVSLFLVRRWSYVRKAYFAAIADTFRMRRHVQEWRKRIRSFRKRGDFWMCRFLRLRPSRWDEVKRLFKFGAPKVDGR